MRFNGFCTLGTLVTNSLLFYVICLDEGLCSIHNSGKTFTGNNAFVITQDFLKYPGSVRTPLLLIFFIDKGLSCQDHNRQRTTAFPVAQAVIAHLKNLLEHFEHCHLVVQGIRTWLSSPFSVWDVQITTDSIQNQSQIDNNLPQSKSVHSSLLSFCNPTTL